MPIVFVTLLSWLAGLAGPAVVGPRASMDTELSRASEWLVKEIAAGHIAAEESQNYKFFTTYAVPADINLNLAGGEEPPTNLRAVTPLVLSFVLNSMADPGADGKSVPPRAITPTLYMIDIRDYGWDTARWDAAIGQDPYASTTLTGDQAHLITRADWFIVHALDPARQLDLGLKADQVIHYLLIYGVNGTPKTIDEFRQKWSVDKALAEKAKADFGSVIERGKSAVSHGTRQLIGYRTVLGEYWETRDDAAQDYVENLLTQKFAAGEAITNNSRGLQVYLLFDSQGNRVDIADPKFVVDRTDRSDPRVRTGISCVRCHGIGINPASNELAEMIAEGVRLNVSKKDLARRIEAFYLDGKFDDTTTAANTRFARAVAHANGLTATTNVIALQAVTDWYNGAVTRNQAAVELGLDPDEVGKAISAATSGRLAALAKYDKVIPRLYWEQQTEQAQKLGAYAEAVLHVKGKTAAPPAPTTQPVPAVQPVPAPVTAKPKHTKTYIAVTAHTNFVHSGNRTTPLTPDMRVPYLGREENGYYLGEIRGIQGWVLKTDSRLETVKED